MTITIPIALPASGHLVITILVAVLAFYSGTQFMRIQSDRSWDKDIRHRATQQVFAPWQAPAPADVIERPSTDISIFRLRRFADPNEEQRMAA